MQQKVMNDMVLFLKIFHENSSMHLTTFIARRAVPTQERHFQRKQGIRTKLTYWTFKLLFFILELTHWKGTAGKN